MPYAHFAALDLDVPLPENWFYHDEGPSRLDITSLLSVPEEGHFVPVTIEARSLEAVLQHQIRYFMARDGLSAKDARLKARQTPQIRQLLRSFFSTSHEAGVCMFYGPRDYGTGPETHLHIFYLDKGREDVNLFLRGHEEGHALSKIPGGLSLMEERKEGPSLSFSTIRNQELLADCVAVHALHTQGFAVDDVVAHYQHIREKRLALQLQRARYIYETSDYSALGFHGHRLLSALGRRMHS